MQNKKRALGKGLDAIFGSSTRGNVSEVSDHHASGYGTAGKDDLKFSKEIAVKPEKNTDFQENTDHQGNVSRETLRVRVSLIEPNRNQPRKQFQEESLRELAESMKQYGVLQPLLVKQNGMMYEIIAGERRWRAAKLAGLTEIPVIVKTFNPQEAAEIAIIENIQREDLGAVEEARAYQSLIDAYGMTQEEVAERVSKNRTTITNSLRLLQLSEPVLDLLSEGKLTAGHARCLLSISDPAVQEEIAKEIVNKKISVRETEKLVKQLSSPKKKKKPEEEEEQELDMYLVDLARKMTARLNTKVLIKQGSKGRGKILIDYYSNDDLEKIMDKLRR